MKKFIKTTSILFMLLCFCTTILAATVSSENAKLEIVENNICTISIGELAKFEKKITETNLENKEITIGLTVTNIADTIYNKPTEVFLVIDNSISMRNSNVTPTSTRLDAVTDAANILATELLKIDTVKVGVVSFSTGDNEGTITDATLLTTPSNDETTVTDAISGIVTGTLGVRTNIDAGITLANQNFTTDCDSKYMVLLTDGVPNTSIGGPTHTYSGETTTNTLAKLNAIEDADVNIYTVMTGVEDTVEGTSGKSYKALAEEIFGTNTSPNVGEFYYIDDSQINTVITQTILNSLVDTTAHTLNNIEIYDYFPQNIIDNFDFEIVEQPNIGTVSTQIDADTRSILWTIDSLEPTDVARLSYKLTLKDNINSEILDVVLSTNEKVDITTDETEPSTSDVTPKVKVTIPETPVEDDVENVVENVVDNTVANTQIPQTGTSNSSLIFIGICIALSVFICARLYNINKKSN